MPPLAQPVLEKERPLDFATRQREQPCPGWASNRCANCDCPWYVDPPRMIAPKGATLQGRQIVWEQPHPDDIREIERQRAQRRAVSMMRSATEGQKSGRGYAMAALRGEAQNIINDGRHNDQINISAYKLRKYVQQGGLTEQEVAQTVWDASYEPGYEQQIIGTIASGLGISKADVMRLVNR